MKQQQQQQQRTLRRVDSSATLASSFASSACSEALVFTDYGLARALTSRVVPNEQNPIATIKDRKNANYIEDLADRHTRLKASLDEAVAKTTNTRAACGDDINAFLKHALDGQLLEANKLLTHCSREYSCFLHDVQELAKFPKMSREELARSHSVRKAAEKAIRDAVPLGHTRLLKAEDPSFDEQGSSTVPLTAHSADIERLTENFTSEKSHILSQFASAERLCAQHKDDVDRLYEDLAYQEHINRLKEREKEGVSEDLQNSTRANQMLKHDLEVQRQRAVDVNHQLQETQNDIRNYQGQLSYARATAMQLKDENKALRLQVDQLNEMCILAREQLEQLLEEKERMTLEREKMAELRESQRETNAYLREEFGELHGQAVQIRQSARLTPSVKQDGHRDVDETSGRASAFDYAAKLREQVARLKSRAARRDSVVSDSADGEDKRPASA